MLQVLHMGLHVCQLMGYGQINDGLNLITHHSARTLNLQDYGIAAGNSANLIILPAENGFDALRRQVPVRYSVRGGKVIASTKNRHKPPYIWSSQKPSITNGNRLGYRERSLCRMRREHLIRPT